MSSFEELFQSATRHTREPLTDGQGVAEASTLLVRLHHSFRHGCRDPWDLAKIASSSVRCSLTHTGISSPCEGLLSLIAVGFHICPLSICVDTSLTVKRRDYAALPALKAPLLAAVAVGPHRTSGATVVLSLIGLLHRAESYGPCAWKSYAALSSWAGEMIAELANLAAPATLSPPQRSLRATYTESWAGGLLSYAMRWADREDVVEEAAALLLGRCGASDDAILRRLLTGEGCGDTVHRQWRALQGVLQERCMRGVRAYAEGVGRIWSTQVKPTLAAAFSREPAPLSETFFKAPALTLQDAHALAGPVLSQLADAAASGPVAQLSRRCALLAEASGGQAAAAETLYSTLIRQTVTIALRTGQTSTAESLLDWGAKGAGGTAAGAHYAAWGNRLRALHGRPHSSPSMDWPPLVQRGLARCMADWPREPVLWPRYVQAVAGELQLGQALDTIVTSSELEPLRIVVDACLCTSAGATCTWPRDLLTDPFASVFLCRATAKICHLLLNRGDAALARAYITRLALCVMACPSHECLLLLLQLLCRLGAVLTAGDSLTGQPSGGALAREQWAALSKTLRHLLPADPHKHLLVDGVGWEAYRASPCRSAHGEGSDAIAADGHAVTVAVVLDGDDIVLERRWCWQGFAPEPCAAALRLVGRRAALEAVLARARGVTEANREQLRLGTDAGVGPAPETARAAASVAGVAGVDSADASLVTSGAVPSSAEDRQARKREWWGQRFELDRQMFQVMGEMEEVLGLTGVLLLLGEPCEAVQAPLWELAKELARSVASADESADLRGHLHTSALQSLCYCTLQGLPYLMTMHTAPLDEAEEGNGAAGSDICNGTGSVSGSVVSPPSAMDANAQRQPRPHLAYEYLPTALVHPASLDSAAARAAMALTAAVEELLHYARADAHAGHRTVSPSVHGEIESPAGSGEPSRRSTPSRADTYTEVARRALQAMVPLSRSGDKSGDEAVDLVHLHRQHVYLVVDNALHALPLEGVRTLRQSSCSRAPSLDMLQRALAAPDGERCSLRRAHFLVDDGAVTIRKHLDHLFDTHPTWTVERRSTGGGEDANSTGQLSLLTRLAQEQRSAYVYMGHRRGEAYLPARHLYSCRQPCTSLPPLVLLLGCSSARVLGGRTFQCFGMPHAYMHAGARCFVGCIWDITDGEIDRLTKRLLEFVLTASAAGAPITMGEALAAARCACRLPCLSAAATVMYGVNCLVEG